jgi:UDP-N-acetylglucosamine--N-acetylmuramyl-(pentapeptide) pyrophosphoryl-undecaprenol N-acetylglucosamine transferase
MDTLYSLADIAVARGGASTLSELRAWAIPALVVPWPGSRDDHQSVNAQLFSGGGHGFVWDEVQGNVAELVAKLQQLGPPCDAGKTFPADPGIAAEQINQSFLREILRTLEGRDGSWTD